VVLLMVVSLLRMGISLPSVVVVALCAGKRRRC